VHRARAPSRVSRRPGIRPGPRAEGLPAAAALGRVMADYLLEVGCEEIPARMVDAGVADLHRALSARVAEQGLTPAETALTWGGPRRLAVLLRGLPARQPDRSERITGPPADRAFDAAGNPTKAGIGFAQKLG